METPKNVDLESCFSNEYVLICQRRSLISTTCFEINEKSHQRSKAFIESENLDI
jgi:hypothetical protein